MEVEKSKSIGKQGRRATSWNSSRRHSWSFEEVFATANHSRSNSIAEEDEEALKLAALERLTTFDCLRTTVIESCLEDVSEKQKSEGEDKSRHKQVDLMEENQCFINKLFNVAEEDNGKFLKKIRNRYEKFVIETPLSVLKYFELLCLSSNLSWAGLVTGQNK